MATDTTGYVWTCPECRVRITLAEDPAGRKVHHQCPPQQPPKRPNIVRRALTYAQAIRRWERAGRPVRSDEEVAAILGEQCMPCTWYIDGSCHHRNCGCRVNQNKTPLTNKLRMATESCPIGKWSAHEPE
jgi:hypothetical protein